MATSTSGLSECSDSRSVGHDAGAGPTEVLMAGPYHANGRYPGGIASIVNSLASDADQLLAHGIRITPFETCRVRRAPDSGGRLRLENALNAARLAVDLRNVRKRHTYDVVYLHTSARYPLLKDVLVLSVLSRPFRRTPTRTVLHVHFSGHIREILPAGRVANWAARMLMARTVDTIVFLDERTRSEYEKSGGSNGAVISNFHTFEMGRDDAERKSRAVSVSPTTRLLFLGSIDRRKGILDLLSAMHAIPADVRLNVGGSFTDPDIEREFYVQSARLEGRVSYLGFVQGEDKARLLALSHLFVLPSYGEGLPISILEAMANACAIVATPVGAVPDVVGPEMGALNEPGDVSGIAVSITRLHRDRVSLAAAMESSFLRSQWYTKDRFLSAFSSVCECK